MREARLWENERYVGPSPSEPVSISSTLEPSLSRSSFASLTSLGGSPQRTRMSRLKGRGNGTGGQDSLEDEGQVNSLTFPLAPGRLFVPTEDWREDVVTEWALNECSSGDEDGWVYTNDAWQDPQPSPVRRVWKMAKEAMQAEGGRM
ncbi:hypothetical protein AX14_009859 [Amanita brunnescens Koide BX004]|nr:hypothetical protein AX14_009859 [Amanita brunnescens Koide BX004]